MLPFRQNQWKQSNKPDVNVDCLLFRSIFKNEEGYVDELKTWEKQRQKRFWLSFHYYCIALQAGLLVTNRGCLNQIWANYAAYRVTSGSAATYLSSIIQAHASSRPLHFWETTSSVLAYFCTRQSVSRLLMCSTKCYQSRSISLPSCRFRDHVHSWHM